MADIKTAYGSNGQAITITLAALADSSFRQATAISNTTNLFLDALIAGSITTAASGVSSTGYIRIYAAASADGGTTYSGDASGTDAAYSGENNNLHLLATITANTAGTAFEFGPLSVAQAFGGFLPASWTLVVENGTGAALDSGSLHYQGVYLTSS